MADSIIRRDRVVLRTLDKTTGRHVVELTDWNVVQFEQAGNMIEPVDYIATPSTLRESTDKKTNGFLYVDSLTFPGGPWLGDVNVHK